MHIYGFFCIKISFFVKYLVFSMKKALTEELTKTEWKVIQKIGCGMSNKEIASELALSEGTIRNYLSSVLSKLELRDRTQLAIWAVQTGAVNRYI